MLPASILVGGNRYKVVAMAPNEAAAQNIVGRQSYEQLRIEVLVDRPASLVADTLLHELLHAIWDDTHLSDKDEEDYVCRLTAALMALFHNNPKLKDILFREGNRR